MPKPPIEFNRLGSIGQVQNSVTGLDLSEFGGPHSYPAGKFGNALDIPGYTNDGVQTVADSFTYYPEGCMTCWWKPNFDWDAAGSENPYMISLRNVAETRIFEMAYSKANDKFYLLWTDSGGDDLITEWSGVSFSANDWLHLAVTWNKNGINGTSYNLQFYVNGSLLTIAVGDPTTAIYASNVVVTAGVAFRANGNGQGCMGLVDNVKIYDYEKIDFSDRGNERGGLNDLALVA